jgi:cell wall assembly regulator SMI1
MDKQIIKEKVKLLIEVAPPDFEFELKPVATAEEVIKFETQFKVRIPEDYR